VKQKLVALLSICPIVIVLDLVTKSWALSALDGGQRMEILFGSVPLTLAFNRGAAFGLSLGNDPRWFFIPITMLALVLLLVLLKQAESGDWLRVVSVSLVISGAFGNLYDRVRWDRGVVDFLGPIDLGVMLWPIFNVADMAISCGAVLLAVSFWREDRDERLAAEALADSAPSGEEPSGDSDPVPQPTPESTM
jgi:signal peptidase II